MQRRYEHPLAHRVPVDDIHAELQADRVGRQVADRPGDALVELALATEAQAGEIRARASLAATAGHVLGWSVGLAHWLIELP